MNLPLFEQLVGAFSGTTEEAEPVKKARLKGMEQFKKLGFPSRRVEDWKYTNILPFLQQPYALTGGMQSSAYAAEAAGTARIEGLDCYEIILINGVLQTDIAVQGLPSKITICSLKEAQEQSQFARYFTKSVRMEQDHFAALNTAMFSNGVFFHIETVLDKPVHIIHVFESETDLFIQPRHLMIVADHANASILESVVVAGKDTKIFVNTLSEIYVQENAQLDHYVLQNARSLSRWVNHTEVSQRRYSLYNNYTFTLPGADIVRNNLNIALNDEHTETHLLGLYLGAGNQLLDNHTLVNHKYPHCNSNEIYKGVLTGNSSGVFNGKIYVHQAAQKTNAFQQNNNLLIGNRATINSKPQLEIFADDVKCSHGSTAGQLNKEALFYLQSRGISEASAKSLLIQAFAFDVTDKIKLPDFKKHINKQVTMHLHQVENEVI